MKKIFPLLVVLSFILNVQAKKAKMEKPDSVSVGIDSVMASQRKLDSVENSINYQSGKIDLNEIATINLPEGYYYINARQARYIVHTLWENPDDSDILGMIVPKKGILDDSSSFSVLLYYSDEGHIKDDDARDINYSDLMKQMKKDAEDENADRIKQGYSPAHLLGWAVPPYYDGAAHKLHWAKLVYFETQQDTQINYNIRILGRKGYFLLNAIGSKSILGAFNKDATKIISSVDFKSGQDYSSFNPGIDKIAAIGIGGLIAGKILAKVGFFALIVKFWKILALAFAGAIAAIRKYFVKRKANTQVP